MNVSLAGRRALVTGASSGIGEGIAPAPGGRSRAVDESQD